jgi:hypothetical protein
LLGALGWVSSEWSLGIDAAGFLESLILGTSVAEVIIEDDLEGGFWGCEVARPTSSPESRASTDQF